MDFFRFATFKYFFLVEDIRIDKNVQGHKSFGADPAILELFEVEN